MLENTFLPSYRDNFQIILNPYFKKRNASSKLRMDVINCLL